MVKINVDDEGVQTEIQVHEALLSKHSHFFKETFSGDEWTAGERESVGLAETELEVFELFVQFVYTGYVYTAQHDNEEDEEDQAIDEEYERISEC